MNEHIKSLIDRYLDGELDPQQQSQVEAHTANCESCLRALAARRQLSVMIRDVPGIAAEITSANFAAGVLEALDDGYAQDSPWWVELRGLVDEIRTWLMDRRVQQVGWVAAPVLLLLASVFIRSVGILSAVLSLLPDSGSYLGQVSAYMNPLGAEGADLSWGGTLGRMIAFDIGDWGIFTGLFSSLLIGFLYMSWIAGWLFRRPETESVELME